MEPGKSSGDDRTLVGDIAKTAFEPRFTEMREVVVLRSGTGALQEAQQEAAVQP